MRVCITASLVCCLCMCWFRNRLTSLFPCLPLLPSHSRWPGRVKNETGGLLGYVSADLWLSLGKPLPLQYTTQLCGMKYLGKQSSHNISHKMVYFVITLLSFYFTYLITFSLLLYCSAWINLIKLHFCKAKQMRLTTFVMQHITGRYHSKLCQKMLFYWTVSDA